MNRFSTRVKLLDQLLGGGLPDQSATMLFGPSFLGKEELSRSMLQACLDDGLPVILVLTNETAQDVRSALKEQTDHLRDWESKGLLWFVDTYSRSIGADEPAPNIEYLDGAVDLNGVAVALNRVQAKVIREHERHLVILDSVSTLIVHANPSLTFRFLQVLSGRARRAGATFVYLMDHGMHAEAEVQMFRHLASGVISVRGEPGKPQLLVEGLGVQKNPGWIDYRITQTGVEVTGSLAGGRIR